MRYLLIGLLGYFILSQAMAYPEFTCAYEKDHNPPLDQEAEQYFQQARAMEKALGMKNWAEIIRLYEKAVAKDHWKAMNNLALIYGKGKRASKAYPAVERDTAKMLQQYAKMVQLKVPVGYYNWAVGIEKGYIKDAAKGDASSYMFRAAELGSPQAQVRLGNHLAFGLPFKEQRDDLAEQYFRCAGAQDNPYALLSVAGFFKTAKNNMPLAMYSYQKAASLGNTTGMMVMRHTFRDDPKGFDFGYNPDPALVKYYTELYNKLDKNENLRFPNLMKDKPLPRHPTQGYDADNPDIRPE